MILNQNESTFIPVGKLHRLSNPKDVHYLIEIQSGNYLGEDDIERFEDNYGRVPCSQIVIKYFIIELLIRKLCNK